MTAEQLAKLIDDHAAALVLYARQWCACPEDAVQVAFCKLAAQKLWPHDPQAWLFHVVRNQAIDAGKAERRRKTREQAVSRPVRWFQESAIDGLDSERAIQALEFLPEDQREVIVARLWGDLTLQQISEIMGCSVSTSHRRFEAGIAALREMLGVSCPKT